MALKALLNKRVTVDREAKAARDEQLSQRRDLAHSTAMNKINPDLEPGQSNSPERTKVDRTIKSFKLEKTHRVQPLT